MPSTARRGIIFRVDVKAYVSSMVHTSVKRNLVINHISFSCRSGDSFCCECDGEGGGIGNELSESGNEKKKEKCGEGRYE